MRINRNIAVIAFIIILIVVISIISVLTKPEDTGSKKVKTVSPFSISGLSNPQYKLTAQDQVDITDRLKYYLKEADIQTTNLVATVRENSYTYRTINSGYAKEATLLVDIPDVKRTYKTSVRYTHGIHSVYIFCPSDKELKYGTFECEDDSYEEHNH